MSGRVKKYTQSAISRKFSEKGGFSAYFISEGYTIDARNEILPDVINKNGLRVSEGVAWDLVQEFLKACAKRTATTGETVTVGSLMTFGLTIRGWFAKKDSKATLENVRVTSTLLGDLRPTAKFAMANVNDGNLLKLFTVMSPGCGLGEVKQGGAVTINGKWLKLLDDGEDKVSASVVPEEGEPIVADCQIVESDDDHITLTLPNAFSDPALVGREIAFTVLGRCGDPEAETQEESITAKLLEGEAPTGPTMTKVTTEGLEDDQTAYDHQSVLHGTNLLMETGDKLYITLLTADGETDEEEFTGVTAVTSTPTTITSPETGFWPNASTHQDSEWCDPESTVTLKLVKANGATVSHRIYPTEP